MKAILSLLKPGGSKPQAFIRTLGRSFQYIYRIVRHRSFNVNLNTKEFWNKKLSEKGDFWRDTHYRELFDIFPKDKPFSLLDLGCALGDGPRLLKKIYKSAEITGADISEAAINKAKSRNEEIDYIVLDILKDKIPKRYEYITIIETLEHFDDPFNVVDKCLKMCDKALIISTPYTADYSGKIDFVDEHRYSFNETTFENYNARVIKITDFMKETGGKCILYEIRPK